MTMIINALGERDAIADSFSFTTKFHRPFEELREQGDGIIKRRHHPVAAAGWWLVRSVGQEMGKHGKCDRNTKWRTDV